MGAREETQALTVPGNLIAIVLGLALIAAGFFGAHSLASAWVSSRAPTARGQATALYLLFYYLGPSLIGAVSGRLWSTHGWSGVAALIGAMMALMLAAITFSPLSREKAAAAP